MNLNHKSTAFIASTRRWFFSPRLMTLAGTAALAVVFVCVNILVSRFYQRWDATSARLYSLSDVTIETLSRLDQPIEVVVFLSRADPLQHSVRSLLDAYRAETTLLAARFVDPDRNPAEFVALQKEYGIFEGRTQNGRLATEASIVLARGDQRWFITTDDIIVFDEEDGQAKPQLEQALTEGLVNVIGRERIDVCFTQGQREMSLDAGGPESLSEFRRELEQNNYAVRSVDLASPDPAHSLSGCRLVIVAGPATPFSEQAANRLARYFEDGGNLFILVGPVTDDEGRILDPGLARVLDPMGIGFRRNLVFEGDERFRLPVGIGGEVFLATPVSHPTTEAFIRRGEPSERVLIQLGQSLELDHKGRAAKVLHSSDEAVSIESFRALRSGELWSGGEWTPEQHVLAAAFEAPLHDVPNDDTAHPNVPHEHARQHRALVVGSASVLGSSTFIDPGLLGTRRFVENATSWLVSQPSLVSVPEKPSHPAGLNLTDAALGEVQRYVLLYMPLALALIGGLIVYRRRRDLLDDG